MKIAFRAFVLLASVALLLPACEKKKPQAAGGSKDGSAAGEQMPTPVAAPGAGAKEDFSGDAAALAAVPLPTGNGTGGNADFEAWFKKYGLDLRDPNMLEADPDQDGFSNRDEFLAETDPKDPESRPGVHKTIRLKEYAEARLPFIVRGVEGSTATVEFTGDGLREKVKVKKGDTIRGTHLRVDQVSSGFDTDKHGEKVDMSQMVLTDTESDDRLVAVKDLPTRTSDTYATLTDARGTHTLKVREGETFSWPDAPEVSYKVIDLRADAVVVKEEGTGKTLTIPKS